MVVNRHREPQRLGTAYLETGETEQQRTGTLHTPRAGSQWGKAVGGRALAAVLKAQGEPLGLD